MHSQAGLARWLDSIRAARVLVTGDLVLDMHWELADGAGERSLETGLVVQHVRSHACTPGGAGNVARNLRRLGVRRVRAMGPVGDDLFGRELRRLLRRAGVDVALVHRTASLPGVAHGKPWRRGREEERFDFGTAAPVSPGVLEELVERALPALDTTDVLVLNQQVPGRVAAGAWLERLVAEAQRRSVPVWADFRDLDDGLQGLARKMNRDEARAFLRRRTPGDDPAEDDALTRAVARCGAAWTVVTRGALGMLASDGERVHAVAGIRLRGPLDPTGAGDAALAVLAAGSAVRAAPEESLWIANVAAACATTRCGRADGPTADELSAFLERVESGS